MKKPDIRSVALASSTVFSACQMMAFVLYPFFAQRMNLSLAQVISSFSLGSLLFLWGSPYWAQRSEQWGRKPVLIIGLMGLLLSLLVLGFLTLRTWNQGLTLGLLFGSRILYGLTAAAIVPVAQAIMAERSESDQRLQAMTRHSMSLHVGRLIGPFLVWLGLLVSEESPIFISILLLVGLVLISFNLPQDIRSASPASLPHRWRLPASTQSRRLIGLAFLVTCLVGVMQSSLTSQLQTRLHLDSHAAAHLTLQFLLLSSLFTLLVQAFWQKRLRNSRQGSFLVGGLALLFGSFILWNFQSALELWLALPLFSAGISLLTPGYTAALSLGEPASQGRVAGWLGTAHTLGYAAGGGLTALVLAQTRISPLLPGLLLACGLFLLILSLKPRPESGFLQPHPRENL